MAPNINVKCVTMRLLKPRQALCVHACMHACMHACVYACQRMPATCAWQAPAKAPLHSAPPAPPATHPPVRPH